jgi:hypothetical protein
MSAPIISKCSFYKQEWTYLGGQVVISAPVGWVGVVGTLQAGTIGFIIVSKGSFYKEEWT